MSLTCCLVVVLSAAPPSEPHPLKVRVLFGSAPAPFDTEVRLFEPSILCGTAQRQGAPLRQPDEEGWVTFDNASDRAWVVAEHPALGSVSAGVLRDQPMVLTFPAGTAQAGVVVDARGAPAEHARVYAIPKKGVDHGVVVNSNVGTTHFATRSRVTGPDGRFEFLGLEPDLYALVADEFSEVLSVAEVVKAGSSPVTLRLPARFFAEGRVLDAEGNPMAKARVVAKLAAQATLSPMRSGNAPGPFEKLLEPAPAALNPPGYVQGVSVAADGTFSMGVGVTGPVVLEAVTECASTKTVEVSERRPRTELRFAAEARLEGTVDPAVTLATFHLLGDESRFCERSVVVTDGRFSLAVPAPFTGVVIASEQLRSARLPLHLKPGATTSLGRVKLRSGSPR
jgi:hypothetical protein